MAAKIHVDNDCWLRAIAPRDKEDCLCDGCGLPFVVGVAGIGAADAILCSNCCQAGVELIKIEVGRLFGPKGQSHG